MLSFKILKPIAEVTSPQPQTQTARGALPIHSLGKDNPIVNIICTSENI